MCKFEHDKPYVFISYSSADKDVVWRDADILARNGVNVWLDRELTPGSHWLEDEVKPMIRNRLCCGVLFYISLPSLRSEPVYEELKYAKDTFANFYDEDIIDSESGDAVERRIVPILVDDKVNRILINTSKNANIEKIKKLVTDDGNRMHAIYKQDPNAELEQLIKIIEKWMPTAFLENAPIATPHIVPKAETEPKMDPTVSIYATISPETASESLQAIPSDSSDSDDEYIYTFKQAKARKGADNSFTVLEGSYISFPSRDNENRRAAHKGKYRESDGYVLQDIRFGSSSGAAKFVADCSVSGNVAWKKIENGDLSNRHTNPVSIELVPESGTIHTQEYTKTASDENPAQNAMIVAPDAVANNDVNEQDEFLPLNGGNGGGNPPKTIEYSLYGKEYNENQSNMMLRFFAQVLKRHPDKTEGLPEQNFMNCVSYTNYELKENRTKDMPSYFRVCKFFEIPDGKAVCVGTAYSFNEKLKKMSVLLDLCGEDRDVFNSQNVELPVIKYRQSNSISEAPVPSGVFSYFIYGTEYSGNQTKMIYDFFEALLTKHPDKVVEAAERIASVSLVDFTRDENKTKEKGFVSQFRVCKRIDFENGNICVGASLSSGDKLRAMSKLMHLCGENESIFESDTYTLGAPEKTKLSRAAKSANDFLAD